ncbi:MAG: tyrosine-type recombinase/integrase [Acidobacteriota bacterium]
MYEICTWIFCTMGYMLTLYRRHSQDCKHRSKGAGYTACRCPIWISGQTEAGQPLRESLKTRDWVRATRRLEALAAEEEDAAAPVAQRIAPAAAPMAQTIVPALPALTIEQGLELYRADCRRRHLAPGSLKSYEVTFRAFTRFAAAAGLRDVAELNLAVFTRFHSARQVTANTQRKEIVHLHAWRAFLAAHGYLAQQFSIAGPKEQGPETLPFEAGEVARLLAACDRISNPRLPDQINRLDQKFARALLLLLLYAGLRISDVLQLKRTQVNLETGKVLLRMMKTGHPLYVTLHREAAAALAALPENGPYFFWYQGKGLLETHVARSRRYIRRAARLAKVPNAHPHRFRDTFATALLLKGVSIRTVSLLLGHTSIKTTEKHYAPYVTEYQAALDSATALLNFVA